MDKRKIKWMVNRLTAMSPLEILFRIIRKPREILYKNKYKKYRLITEKNLFNSNIKELWFHGEGFIKNMMIASEKFCLEIILYTVMNY